MAPKLVEKPNRFLQEGIVINEFFGRISSGDEDVGIGRLTSGEGWSEPAQQPEFDEFTIVLSGALHILDVATGKTTVVRAGQAVKTTRGEKIQYSTPEPGGADYISICTPAFSPNLSHRDPE